MNSAGLEQAIYNRLTGYVDLTSRLGTAGVRTRVPQSLTPEDNAPFPFVTFDVPSETPFDTKTSDGVNAVVRIHVWYRGNSKLPRRMIEDAVYDALQKYELVISGSNVVTVNFESKTEFDDPDGATTHGVLNFRVVYDDGN